VRLAVAFIASRVILREVRGSSARHWHEEKIISFG
jgi:hypothetical protein